MKRLFVLDGRLYAAGSTIQVWDLSTKKTVKSYTGHASTVSQMSSQSGFPLVSIAEHDRFINIWNIDDAGHQSENTALTMDVNANCVDMMDGNVLAVMEDGQLAIWRTPFTASQSKKQKKQKTKKFEQLLKIKQEDDETKTLPIHSARFIQPEQVIVVYGALAKPTIELVNLNRDEQVIELKRQANTQIFIDSKQQMSKPSVNVSDNTNMLIV